MQHEISLGFLFKCLKKCWILMLVCTVVVALIAGVAVNFLVDDTYSASVKFYARNNDYNSDVVSQSNLSATAQLINDYIDLIGSNAVLTQVSEELAANGIEMTPEEIKGTLSSSSSENSSMFVIKVTHRDSSTALAIAQAINKVAPEAVTEIAKNGYLTTEYISSQVAEVVRRIGKVEGIDWYLDKPQNYETMIQGYIDQTTPEGAEKVSRQQVIEIIELMEDEKTFQYAINEPDNFAELIEQYLNENTSLLKDISLCFTSVEISKKVTTNSPSTLRYAAIGGIAAAAIVYLIFFLKGILETNVSSEDDLKRLVNRPIIGTIPSWEIASKK